MRRRRRADTAAREIHREREGEEPGLLHHRSWNASLDLQGCPAIGRCGPLVSPNLYTPPGIALTVCDTPPSLTTYSVTVNTITGGSAGVLKEAYVFVRNHVLTVYAGKKVGDLALVWVSQEQGDLADHRLYRGCAAGADGEPDQQVVLCRRHQRQLQCADLAVVQIPDQQ